MSHKKFVEPVWRVKKPFEPNLGLANQIRNQFKELRRVNDAVDGYEIPSIDERLYSSDIREAAQGKITAETEKRSFQDYSGDGRLITRYKKGPAMQHFQLEQGFAFTGNIELQSDNFDNFVDKLDRQYGALLPKESEVRFITGEDSFDQPNKNYCLIQENIIGENKNPMFSLFIRYALPEFARDK